MSRVRPQASPVNHRRGDRVWRRCGYDERMTRRSVITSVAVMAALCSLVLQSGAAFGACSKTERATIAVGKAPGGTPWSMSASVESRGSCKRWHFGVKFGSKEFGYSESDATVAPGSSGGQLQVDASDIRNRAGTAAAFVGYVTANAKEVLAITENGKHFAVRLRQVTARKAKNRSWLRSFRYFVFFHSGDSQIERLAVIGAGGKVLETAENQGLFFG